MQGTNMDVFASSGTSQMILYVVGGVLVSAITCRAVRKRFFSKKERKVYPKDTVILYQIGRGPYAPSLVPYVVKLETYLRMAKIPYQNVHGFNMSSKGKTPWIEYNGVDIADSTVIITFLNKELGVDLNRNLTPADRGVAQALQCLVEDHLYWFLVLFRWVYDNDKTFVFNSLKIGKFVMWKIRGSLGKQTWGQGLGRHTETEATAMMRKDLQSLDSVLGKKKFLFGDEPCEVDATVFGQLSQFYWHFLGTGHDTIIKDEYPSLAAYCERMKTRFWPDWDECITHGWTRKAIK